MEPITFRSALNSGIGDFLSDAGIKCVDTTSGVVEVAAALATYREEGRDLFPEVWVIDDLRAVQQVFQAQYPLRIGHGPRGADTARNALKQCAPLAQNGWAVYLLRSGSNEFEFGLVRSSTSPLALRPESLMADGGPTLVRLRQVASQIVELRCGTRIVDVHFTATRPETARSGSTVALDGLVNAATARLPVAIRAPATEFLFRTVFKALQESHGSLIAVVDSAGAWPTVFGEDCVELGEGALDFLAKIQEFQTANDFAARDALMGAADLLRGMIGSDGVTVITDAMKVVAYRAFIRPDKVVTKPGGGARRRTFEFLAMQVEEGALVGAFYRSQDGASEFRGRK
jgi:hypothetical protein